MAILNLRKDEVAAVVRTLTHAPKTEPIVSVRRKLELLQQPAQPLAGQMDVFDCIREAAQ